MNLLVSLLPLALGALFSHDVAASAKFTCYSKTNLGKQGKTSVYWRFAADRPLLRYSYKVYNNQGKVEYREYANYISMNQVCGKKVNFRRDCRHHESKSSSSYRYSFRCSNGVSGRVTFFTNGVGSFYCYHHSGSNERATLYNCRNRRME